MQGLFWNVASGSHDRDAVEYFEIQLGGHLAARTIFGWITLGCNQHSNLHLTDGPAVLIVQC